MSNAPKLGIIAGRGDLPLRLIETARAAGRDFYVLAIKNQADCALSDDVPHDWVRLGAAGQGLDLLRAAGVTEVVFAGGIERPSLTALMPDARMARFLAKLASKSLGDDSVLRVAVAEFEAEGFRVIGADDLRAELVMSQGKLGRHAPDDSAWIDIRLGIRMARAIGALDIGQAVVVQQGVVLGVEGAEGTDELIARCGRLQKEGPAGVLVKAMKPGQERRVDLPTIGPDTVAAAAAAGLRGIAVEADQALIIDRAKVIAEADRLGLFLVGFTAEAEFPVKGPGK